MSPVRLFKMVIAVLAMASASPSYADPAKPEQGAAAEVRPTPPAIPSPRPEVVQGEVATKRFVLLYTEASEGMARALSERIEAVRDEFQRVIGRDWPGVTELRVGKGREEFNALALPGGRPPPWAEAIAYPGRNIILLDGLSLSKPQGEVTLRHELSHVALGQLGEQWPHWFQEGLAMYLTGDRLSLTQYGAMFRAVTQERIFSFEDLSDGWPQHPMDVEIAYAQSVSFVSYLIDRYGSAKMGELVDHVQQGSVFEVAFARAFQSTLRVEQEIWEKTLPARYSWMPIVTGGTAVWTLAAALTFAGWFRRRRTRAAAMAAMEAQEAAEDAAQRLALALNRAPPATGEEELPFSAWPAPAQPPESAEQSESPPEAPDDAPAAESAAPEEAVAEEPEDAEDGDDPDIRPRRILH